MSVSEAERIAQNGESWLIGIAENKTGWGIEAVTERFMHDGRAYYIRDIKPGPDDKGFERCVKEILILQKFTDHEQTKGKILAWTPAILRNENGSQRLDFIQLDEKELLEARSSTSHRWTDGKGTGRLVIVSKELGDEVTVNSSFAEKLQCAVYNVPPIHSVAEEIGVCLADDAPLDYRLDDEGNPRKLDFGLSREVTDEKLRRKMTFDAVNRVVGKMLYYIKENGGNGYVPLKLMGEENSLDAGAIAKELSATGYPLGYSMKLLVLQHNTKGVADLEGFMVELKERLLLLEEMSKMSSASRDRLYEHHLAKLVQNQAVVDEASINESIFYLMLLLDSDPDTQRAIDIGKNVDSYFKGVLKKQGVLSGLTTEESCKEYFVNSEELSRRIVSAGESIEALLWIKMFNCGSLNYSTWDELNNKIEALISKKEKVEVTDRKAVRGAMLPYIEKLRAHQKRGGSFEELVEHK